MTTPVLKIISQSDLKSQGNTNKREQTALKEGWPPWGHPYSLTSHPLQFENLSLSLTPLLFLISSFLFSNSPRKTHNSLLLEPNLRWQIQWELTCALISHKGACDWTETATLFWLNTQTVRKGECTELKFNVSFAWLLKLTTLTGYFKTEFFKFDIPEP